VTGDHGEYHGLPSAFRWQYVLRSEPDLAAAAEALGVTTDWIMAVAPDADGEVLVLFSPDGPEDETLWSAWLVPDADGILHERERVRRPGMLDKIMTDLAQRMEGQWYVIHLTRPRGEGREWLRAHSRLEAEQIARDRALHFHQVTGPFTELDYRNEHGLPTEGL
jgi:hypothetical protein